MKKLKISKKSNKSITKKKTALKVKGKAEPKKKVEDVSNRQYFQNQIKAIEMKEEVKEVFVDLVEKLIDEFEQKVEKRFDEELRRLHQNGQFYRAEYKDFTMSDIVKKGGIAYLNKLGWHFCFDYEDIKGVTHFTFMKQKESK